MTEGNAQDNAVAKSWRWIKDHTGSPLAASLLFGTAAGLGTRLLWNPVLETARSLSRPLKMVSGRGSEIDEAIDSVKYDSKAKQRLPLAVGLLSAAGMAALAYNKRYEHGGLLSWDAPFTSDLSAFYGDYRKRAALDRDGAGMAGLRKSAALDKRAFGMESYVQNLDWGRRVPLQTAQGLFTNDPYLPTRDRYTMNMGTAIVTDAAIRQNTSQPTLGGIFDSAASKIGGKLSLGGLAGIGTKAMIANGAARLFTGAVGAVLGLGKDARQNLVDAGTWAGTMSAILN